MPLVRQPKTSTPSILKNDPSNTAATTMATSSAIAGLSGLAGAFAQSQAMQAQGEYQQRMFDLNAQLAERQARDAIRRGEKDAVEYKKQVGKFAGAQRASMAAQGIALDSGTALEIQQETAEIGARDAITIQNDAWRQAWGFKFDANNSRSQGRMAELAGRTSAGATLLTGGLGAVRDGLQGYSKYKG